MKRFFLYLLLIVTFLSVDKVYAEGYWTTVDSKENITEGEKVAVDFVFDFDDARSYDSKYGIYMIAFEIQFDDTVFDIVDIEYNSNWNQEVDKADGKYLAIAVPKSSNDKIRLNIGKFIMRLYFNTKSTDKTTTSIKIGEFGGILLEKSALYNETIDASNYKTIEATGDHTHTFKITKSETPVNNNTNSIVQNKKNVNISSEIKKETNTIKKKDTKNESVPTNKDYINYLSTLEIEGYKIDFNKHQSIYQIDIPKDVNSLNINAIAESTSAKVEITGKEDLEANHNKVIIKVTAKNGDEKKYIINVNKIEEKKDKKQSSFVITDDQIKLIIIFASIILGIGLLIYIIIRIRDRKIEKGMDKW